MELCHSGAQAVRSESGFHTSSGFRFLSSIGHLHALFNGCQWMKKSNNIIAINHGKRFQKFRRVQEHTGHRPDKVDSARYESRKVKGVVVLLRSSGACIINPISYSFCHNHCSFSLSESNGPSNKKFTS